METKLILIEGIPGSGKTTLSNEIYNEVKKLVPTKIYPEGSLNPADVASLALLNSDELEYVIRKFPDYKDDWDNYLSKEEDDYFIAYTKMLDNTDDELWKYLEKHQLLGGRSTFEQFKEILFKRWKNFIITNSYTNIFECSFLQNNITDLLLYYQLTDSEIIDFLKELWEVASPLNPIILYIDCDADATITKNAAIRVDENNVPVWLNSYIRYIEESPYGKSHQLVGYEGLISFLHERQRIEHQFLDLASINHFILSNEDYDLMTEEAIDIVLDNLY